jgi:hypothetical protein
MSQSGLQSASRVLAAWFVLGKVLLHFMHFLSASLSPRSLL